MMKRHVFGCLAGLMVLLSAHGALAQQGSSPSQLLSQYPNGGPVMETQVQDLMNADRANLAAIIAFAKAATEDQRKAIARGLAGVAKAYAASDPGLATQIQQSVAAAGLPDLAKAYAEAAGDTGTAAAGGGGGGGGGGAGGGGGPTAAGPPQGGANASGALAGNNFAATQSFGLTGGGSVGSAASSQASPF